MHAGSSTAGSRAAAPSASGYLHHTLSTSARSGSQGSTRRASHDGGYLPEAAEGGQAPWRQRSVGPAAPSGVGALIGERSGSGAASPSSVVESWGLLRANSGDGSPRLSPRHGGVTALDPVSEAEDVEDDGEGGVPEGGLGRQESGLDRVSGVPELAPPPQAALPSESLVAAEVDTSTGTTEDGTGAAWPR